MVDRYFLRVYLVLCLLLLCFIGSIHKTHAQSSHKLQALYIFSFAKYVTWEKDTSKFVIGVLGESDIMQELEEGAVQRKIGGKPVEIQQYNTLADFRHCHILYLPRGYSKLLPRLLEITEGKPILIVSEEDLAKKGIAISFFVEDNRLRFKINVGVIKTLGLIVNKGLLDLAVVI